MPFHIIPHLLQIKCGAIPHPAQIYTHTTSLNTITSANSLFIIYLHSYVPIFYYQNSTTENIKSRKARCLCGFPTFRLLFELGVSLGILNCICLIFMQIHACFYFNYIIYYGLLIFCCQKSCANVSKT